MAKVTVVIPNYNHAGYLVERLESVLNQTYQDFEVLYLDDASTDKSAEVFEPYENHPKIRVLRNTHNSGSPFKQWNKGVREAKSEYVWIAEADDYANSHFLEALVPFLEANSNVGLAYCESWSVDEDSQTLESCAKWTAHLDAKRWQQDFVCDGPELCARFMMLRNVVPNASAVLFRRSVYEDVGYADESMRICGDWKLWAQMMLASQIAFTSRPLNYFRTHKGSVRAKISRSEKNIIENYNVREFIAQNIPIEPACFEKSMSDLAHDWLYGLGGSGLPMSSHLHIYRAARRLDRKINSRILSKFAYGARWRLGHKGLPPSLTKDHL